MQLHHFDYIPDKYHNLISALCKAGMQMGVLSWRESGRKQEIESGVTWRDNKL